ncbi:hypothetical protein AGLY_011374 [Aphis glycines]|uniref:Uncharacterized protein n=1 Tax=Aphis glycines TaxID=307491 RepID=A0A6G0TDN3_APHGL|nr:hypothetical protein AGLY_011374 [Aphis glycines]
MLKLSTIWSYSVNTVPYTTVELHPIYPVLGHVNVHINSLVFFENTFNDLRSGSLSKIFSIPEPSSALTLTRGYAKASLVMLNKLNILCRSYYKKTTFDNTYPSLGSKTIPVGVATDMSFPLFDNNTILYLFIPSTLTTSKLEDSLFPIYKFLPFQSKAMTYGAPTKPVSSPNNDDLFPPIVINLCTSFDTDNWNNMSSSFISGQFKKIQFSYWLLLSLHLPLSTLYPGLHLHQNNAISSIFIGHFNSSLLLSSLDIFLSFISDQNIVPVSSYLKLCMCVYQILKYSQKHRNRNNCLWCWYNVVSKDPADHTH